MSALGLCCCTWAFSSCSERGAGVTLHCGERASHCSGFSCCGTRALGMWASVAVALRLSSCGLWAPVHRLSSYYAWAQLFHGMWDFPGPGMEPMSPALTGGFLTTAPPGKSPDEFYLFIYLFIYWLCWVFVAARGLSLVAASRGYSSSQCVGFSLWWHLLLQSMGSRRVGFLSCNTQAQ